MDQASPSTNKATEDQDPLDQTMFYLDATQAQAFRNLLEMPVTVEQSNPGLDRLMAITAPWADRNT